MPKKSRQRVLLTHKSKRHTQIAVYAPGPLLNLLYREADRRHRKLGPTVLEICWEYFNKGKATSEAANVVAASTIAETLADA